MTKLSYVPLEQFRRARRFNHSLHDQAQLFATLCRINTLYMIAQAGSGHIGTCFSSLDIVTWLFLNELRSGDGGEARDLYFSSKGHDAPALYSVMLALEMLDWDLLHELRRLGGLPGHPDVSTPGIVTNTGSLGMGISKAKGMIAANHLDGSEGRVFVLLGDGELQEGQFWESLVSAANRGTGEIIAIVDNNKIQSDTWVSNVSDLGDLEAKFAAYGWHVERCDGHDLDAFATVLSRAKDESNRPSVIIADTVKGKGVSFMEWGEDHKNESLYPFHSGAPDPATYDRALAELTAEANLLLGEAGAEELILKTVERESRQTAPPMQKLVAAYSEALLEQARANSKIVSLDADLVLDTGQIPFRQAFPDRFIECGIAEQDMVSQAGGLALKGYLPIVHSFACFLSTRPNEQIYNNASEGSKIIYVGSLAGILPGGPGHSHQSVRDISALAGIPSLTMIQPSCEREVKLALAHAVNGTNGSTYLRLVSIPCVVPYELPADYVLEPGRGVALSAGRDAVIFGYGPVLLSQAVEAVRRLEKEAGIGVSVVNLPWLNRVDKEWLVEIVGERRHVFTLDDHYIEGGQGERILAALAEAGVAGGIKATRFGLNGIPACGRNDEVLRHHGLDADSLAHEIRKQMTVG